jgi:hypothetical protein
MMAVGQAARDSANRGDELPATSSIEQKTEQRPWHSRSAQDVAAELRVEPTVGLDSDEVACA